MVIKREIPIDLFKLVSCNETDDILFIFCNEGEIRSVEAGDDGELGSLSGLRGLISLGFQGGGLRFEGEEEGGGVLMGLGSGRTGGGIIGGFIGWGGWGFEIILGFSELQ